MLLCSLVRDCSVQCQYSDQHRWFRVEDDKNGEVLPSYSLKFSERLAVKFSSVVVADNRAIAEHVETNYNSACETIAYGGDHAFVDDTAEPTA